MATETEKSNREPLFGLGFSLFAAALAGAFAGTLIEWVKFCLKTDLYSHALLIPAISIYLAGLNRAELPSLASGWSKYAWIPLIVGVMALGSYGVLKSQGWEPAPVDSLSLRMLSFVALLIAGAAFFWGKARSAALLFPLVFLIFMVPFPAIGEHAIEMFFQHTSAEASAWLFTISGTPFLRDGLIFELPGITMKVAQECSGIRSSFVLFITSLLAGYMFLKSPWKRSFLAFLVIPLGIVRNGLRILTLGLLCVHVDPSMIDSWVHKRGGPVFFAASLIPFFAILFLLRRSERGKREVR